MSLREKMFWALVVAGVLLVWLVCCGYGHPPKLEGHSSRLSAQRYFIAATASNGVLESDYSNEVVCTNATKTVSLAWDAPVGAASNWTYRAYWGPATRNYTNSTSAGTNCHMILWLLGPDKTNRVIRVWATRATNMVYAANPGLALSLWTLAGTTNWIYTNPPTRRCWRALGAGSRVYITNWFQ